MNKDKLERGLREPGPREDGYEAASLPRTLDDAGLRATRSGLLGWFLRAGALTAAVAAGIVLAVLLTRGGGPLSGVGSAASGSPAPSATVEASASTIETPPATPTATQTPGVIAECRAGDFAWAADPWGGAAGSRGTTVLARGVTSLGACRIDGRATLTLRDANGATLAVGMSAATEITVHAGTVIQLGVTWSNWCGAMPARPWHLAVVLPADSLEVPLTPSYGDTTTPPCNGPGQPSTLGATDFQLSTRTMPDG